MKRWKENHPEEAKAAYKEWRDRWKGILEVELHGKVYGEFVKAVSLDMYRPDFFDPVTRCFVEIKRALPLKKSNWMYESGHFPGLFFMRTRPVGKDGRLHASTIDEQIAKYPKPLLVIVFHALTGEEIIRKLFD